jgi:hypothetical protein
MVSVEIVRCRIPELLIRIRKSQSWLGEVTGYGKQRISDYVNVRDREVMSLRTALVIAHFLKCHVNELYEYRVMGIGKE